MDTIDTIVANALKQKYSAINELIRSYIEATGEDIRNISLVESEKWNGTTRETWYTIRRREELEKIELRDLIATLKPLIEKIVGEE